MTRENFLDYLRNDNWGSVLYAYHKENNRKGVLSPVEFSKYISTLQQLNQFGFFDLDEFINLIVRKYKVKFEVTHIFSKEGKLIKYV